MLVHFLNFILFAIKTTELKLLILFRFGDVYIHQSCLCLPGLFEQNKIEIIRWLSPKSHFPLVRRRSLYNKFPLKEISSSIFFQIFKILLLVRHVYSKAFLYAYLFNIKFVSPFF